MALFFHSNSKEIEEIDSSRYGFLSGKKDIFYFVFVLLLYTICMYTHNVKRVWFVIIIIPCVKSILGLQRSVFLFHSFYITKYGKDSHKN